MYEEWEVRYEEWEVRWPEVPGDAGAGEHEGVRCGR